MRRKLKENERKMKEYERKMQGKCVKIWECARKMKDN